MEELRSVARHDQSFIDAVDKLDVSFDDLVDFAEEINSLESDYHDDLIIIPPVDFRKLDSYVKNRLEEEEGSIDADVLQDEICDEFDLEMKTSNWVMDSTCEFEHTSPQDTIVIGLHSEDK